MSCQCFDAGAIGGRAALRACEGMLDVLGIIVWSGGHRVGDGDGVVKVWLVPKSIPHGQS